MRWFWDRPIGVKVATALLVLGTVFGAVGGAGAVALYRAGTHLEQMSELTSGLQSAMAELRAAQARSHLLVHRAAAAPDATTRTQLLTSSAWVDEQVAQQIDVIERFPQSEGAQWAEFVERWDAWRPTATARCSRWSRTGTWWASRRPSRRATRPTRTRPAGRSRWRRSRSTPR